jgi:glycosyltransferase involved in cell wall biosynthesis
VTGTVLELLGPSTGGIRRHVDVLADGLTSTGWKVRVAGPAGVMDGLRDDAASVDVGLGPRSLWRGRRALRAQCRHVDLVHAHGLTAGWLAVLSGVGVPVVLTVHNVVLDEAAGRRAGLLRRLEGRLPKQVARTIAVSPQIADQLCKASGRPIEVIVPVSPEPRPRSTRAEIRAGLCLDADTLLVVTVARLHPQKGLLDLLAAVASLGDRSDLRVAVVGEGPQRAALIERSQTLGLDDTVTFVGAQPDGAGWIAAADLVVVSSIWEGSPLVVGEALRLGRPLLSTQVGDVAEVVRDGETGRLVPPRRPDLLGAAMGAMLGDPDTRARLAEAGRERAEARYDEARLVKEVADVYNDLIEAHP